MKKILRVEYLFILLYLLSLFFIFKQMSGELIVPRLVNIGRWTMTTYGILMVFAIIVGSLIVASIKPQDLDEIDILAAILWVTLPALVFARLWHVATDFNLYYDNIANVLSIHKGGLSIFGGLLGGSLGLILFSWLHGFSVKLVVNMVTVAVPFGQAIGRFGNLINQELFGPPSNSFFKMYVNLENRPLEYLDYDYFHPAFLYESISCLVLFIFLLLLWNLLLKRNKDILDRTFLLVGGYLIGYGIIRFLVEFYRLEDRLIFHLSLNQIISLILVSVGMIYLVKLFLNQKILDEKS